MTVVARTTGHWGLSSVEDSKGVANCTDLMGAIAYDMGERTCIPTEGTPFCARTVARLLLAGVSKLIRGEDI